MMNITCWGSAAFTAIAAFAAVFSAAVAIFECFSRKRVEYEMRAAKRRSEAPYFKLVSIIQGVSHAFSYNDYIITIENRGKPVRKVIIKQLKRDFDWIIFKSATYDEEKGLATITVEALRTRVNFDGYELNVQFECAETGYKGHHVYMIRGSSINRVSPA